MFVATVALNRAVLFTTLQHRYVLPLVMFRIGPCEFTLVYDTYHTHILFLKDTHVHQRRIVI